MKFIETSNRIVILIEEHDTLEERKLLYTSVEYLKAILNALAAKVEREV